MSTTNEASSPLPSVATTEQKVVVTKSSAATRTSVIPSGLKSFLSGGVGGICVVLVGHPLDLIKVRMQTGGAGSSSVMGMLMSTFRQSGISGLYRGVSAPLTAVTPIFALSFWGYDMGQRIVQTVREKDTLSIPDKVIAGGLSGIPPTLLMGPSERIKVLLQTAPAGKYKSMGDCALQVYKEGGMRSVFRGTALTFARDIPGSMAWFGTYEAVKLGMTQWQGMTDPSQLSPAAVLTAGGCAGMMCWSVAMPADVVKSRVQSGSGESAWQVASMLYKQEGMGAFFKGIRPALIRAFPANAACFMGMEMAQKGLQWADEQVYDRYY